MEYVQYGIIGIVFIMAIAYVVRRFIPAKGAQGGCSKGCGCDMSKSTRLPE